METLTTAAVATQLSELLGHEVSSQKVFRLAAKHGVTPALEAPGKRGAKFWHARDVEWIARLEREAAA